ncbi:hypothetical protein [Streptomyces sp. NPDC058466]|uniref:hypothetical protein n=1 Tax=Streptomyces sp. NPDC058466 TaxID=3346512 RepID=UPI00364F0329
MPAHDDRTAACAVARSAQNVDGVDGAVTTVLNAAGNSRTVTPRSADTCSRTALVRA